MPNVFNWLFDKMNLPILMSNPIDLYVNLLPINEFNNLLVQIPWLKLQVAGHEISMFIITYTISCVVV